MLAAWSQSGCSCGNGDVAIGYKFEFWSAPTGILICSVRSVPRPPDSNVAVMEGLYDSANQMIIFLSTRKYGTCILTGDFKLPHIDSVSCMASGSCGASSELLLDICFNLSMTQTVQEPTHITEPAESNLYHVFISSAISSRYHTYDISQMAYRTTKWSYFSSPGTTLHKTWSGEPAAPLQH